MSPGSDSYATAAVASVRMVMVSRGVSVAAIRCRAIRVVGIDVSLRPFMLLNENDVMVGRIQ